MGQILTKQQAEAVYSHMRHLSKVGGRVDRIYADGFQVSEAVHTGRVIVHLDHAHLTVPPEIYRDQSAFATAYGLEVAA